MLEILQRNQLYLKPEKCKFHQLKVVFLGLVISQGHIEMDPVKVAGVAKWLVPTKKKEVQSFLGFVNFYQRFIKNFARIAKPLHELTGKKEWKWGVEQEQLFRALQTALTTAPLLQMPDNDSKFLVKADSSDYATGVVLSQEHDGKWHPVAFMSKALMEVERNYEIYDKELLAVVRALEEWSQYLKGAVHHFEILLDHQNLKYFQTARKLNRRQARWSLILSEFDFTLTHRLGKSSGKPDTLS